MRLFVDRGLLKSFWNYSREELRLDKEDSEKWQEPDIYKYKTHPFEWLCKATSNQAELPSPLEYVEFRIFARENILQYDFCINAEKRSVFSFRSKPFSKRILPSKNHFFPTASNLRGYVLNADQEIVADVAGADEGMTRVISFGEGGSRVRRYGDYTTLLGDLGELESLASVAIQTCLTKSWTKLRQLQDTYIHLAPYYDK